ncbi:16S rRNA (guanine(966)-N(2))-methyltransferase RsmD [Aminicella lysinilytica]|jgi:16S rRNA (guanine(966)-N(2))-methyltransferase RsmD|uniref:16S rRNA (Guanine(966)-N(2))-methyltransferase RsmD n=1 Tax=Aminicella lysinilytica TaxID=433323 RepID=A0A4R6PYF8_9FIRM|nr:16S rRNA (guanine(966)-N(2))-methyltransferase RsmD [Aminicella lysinilytica]NLD11363.1 16S rRNA (guanine(966)-N(2))-methyltransferase RsmD [Clostridiales bacterium]TDP52319.1 16S rRNA (guanine(966)-N(2))-methyltransferase RsmD [Aminicella lysinilytica]
MRVITGEFRGRKLDTPIGNDIRPTSDKVKESIFNILMNDIYGRVFCDLFSGTGSLGIEALSRGARRCYFCDSSRDSVNLTKTNIKKCNAESRSVVILADFMRALSRIDEKVDVFILDPPYKAGIYEKCLQQIDYLDLLSPEGIILAEHGAADHMPDSFGRLTKVREKKYGKTKLSIYQCVTEAGQELQEEDNE